MALRLYQPDLHRAANARELDRIGQQVPDRLLKTWSVSSHPNRSWDILKLKVNLFGFSGRPDHLDGSFDDRPQSNFRFRPQ